MAVGRSERRSGAVAAGPLAPRDVSVGIWLVTCIRDADVLDGWRCRTVRTRMLAAHHVLMYQFARVCMHACPHMSITHVHHTCPDACPHMYTRV